MQKTLLSILVWALAAVSISAQTTVFTYQGSLKNGPGPATGNYDFEFKLFDQADAGAQLGSTIQRLNVPVANGIFAVSVDFGAALLPGADRFIEIGLRVNGNPGGFQQLLPRQMLTSSPYSIKSLKATDATQLGGVAASQYVVTSDPRLSDARPPTAGSADYIQNGTTPQAASSFNISGNGTTGGTLSGDLVNTETQYNIGGSRVLGVAGTENTFAGINAGQNNATGTGNSAFGTGAGSIITAGSGNSLFGAGANLLNPNVTNSGAFGRLAAVGANNAIVLGSITGVNNATANTRVGIGTTNPTANLHVQNGGTNAGRIHVGSTSTGGDEKVITFGDGLCPGQPACVYIGERTSDDTMELAATTFNFINGRIKFTGLGLAGSTTLCRNASNEISTCSSSLRYKTNIGSFESGLSFVRKLRPIAFDWKADGMKDVGFGAEDVAKIDPRFVTYNSAGEVEGVKYDRLSVAFVNAFKEQQVQIGRQEKKIEALTQALCSLNPAMEICTQKEQ